MPTLFRPKYTRNGKRVRAKKWYGDYIDAQGIRQRVPLCTDRSAAQAMLNERIKADLHRHVGLTHAFEEHLIRPVADHLDDFERHLEAAGRSPEHVTKTLSRLRVMFDGCDFKRLADMVGAPIVDWLAQQRDREADPIGVRTSNAYLGAAKYFGNWCVRDRRLPSNPLAHLAALNADTDVRRERRAFEPDEFRRLIEATRQGEAFRGLSGRDRALLYVVAAATGLRASEFRSLTKSSFALAAKPPSVTVEAGYSKRRRRDTLPLKADLVALLKPWLASRGEEPLWGGTWAERAADMLRGDLAAARAAWLKEAESNAREVERREAMDFLRDVDGAGRVLDFHALRHSFITNLARAGVHPKEAQALARHSTITLTMDRYTHVAMVDMTTAVERLPAVPQDVLTDIEAPAVLQTTGTDEALCHALCHKPVKTRPSLSIADQRDDPRRRRGNARIPERKRVSPEDSASRPGVIRTHDQGIMSPLL